MSKVIYYDDELNDEFSKAKIEAKKIGDDYVYIHKSFIKKLTSFFWYWIVAYPIAYIYLKLKFSHKIVGKKKLKGKKGYFLYGNHTQDIADPLIPNFIVRKKRPYFVVHPNNVSMPYLGRITPSLGALPLPDTIKATKNFTRAIEKRIEEGNSIVIYPEAHIWPYCTTIRNFLDKSFRYPIINNSEIYCFTNTYQKRRFRKAPKIVTYIDGPFNYDLDKPIKENMKLVRDLVYDAMCKRSLENNVVIYEYKKREEND